MSYYRSQESCQACKVISGWEGWTMWPCLNFYRGVLFDGKWSTSENIENLKLMIVGICQKEGWVFFENGQKFEASSKKNEVFPQSPYYYWLLFNKIVLSLLSKVTRSRLQQTNKKKPDHQYCIAWNLNGSPPDKGGRPFRIYIYNILYIYIIYIYYIYYLTQVLMPL